MLRVMLMYSDRSGGAVGLLVGVPRKVEEWVGDDEPDLIRGRRFVSLDDYRIRCVELRRLRFVNASFGVSRGSGKKMRRAM